MSVFIPSETRRNGFLLGKMKDAEMRGEAAKDTPDTRCEFRKHADLYRS